MSPCVSHVSRRPERGFSDRILGTVHGFPVLCASFLGPDLSEPADPQPPRHQSQGARATHRASWPPPPNPLIHHRLQESSPAGFFRFSNVVKARRVSSQECGGRQWLGDPLKWPPNLLAPCPARLRPALCRGGSRGPSCLQGRGKVRAPWGHPTGGQAWACSLLCSLTRAWDLGCGCQGCC